MSYEPTKDPTHPHLCYARRCREQRGYRMLMCPKHWVQVPSDLQDLIYRTNRNRERGVAGSMRAWLAAINKARDIVTPKDRTPASPEGSHG